MSTTEFINCTKLSDEAVNCNGSIYDLPEKRLTYLDKEFWIYIGIYSALVLIAGLMSGLTMGLLSLDTTTLAVLRDGGTEAERRHAKRILPLVSRHHLLLVTLLLANAGAVEAMPIFLDRVSDPVTAIVVSVTAVLIFGEVIPQAVCTRFGLAIGAALSPVVYFLMGVLFVIAWPLSKILDCLLGHDHGTFYRRGQLKVLVDLHGPSSENGNGSQHGAGGADSQDDEHLTMDEVLIIKGALDMKYKTAGSAMVAIDKVYMLSIDSRLDHEIMTHIIGHGHSRIPVYVGDRSSVKAVLLTKTLIKLNPSDRTPVSSLLDNPDYARPAMFVNENMPLFDLLNQFQTGKSHLAMVQKSLPSKSSAGAGAGAVAGAGAGGDGPDAADDTRPLLMIEDEPMELEGDKKGLVGIITLEDVLEELLQEDIQDEMDAQKMEEVGGGGLLQVAMAKAVKHKLKRSRSQPQEAYQLAADDSRKYKRHLSSSQPEESYIQQGDNLRDVTSGSADPPLVTFA